MGLLFFPRGGSAQVTRYLAAALADAGWAVSLVSGSLGCPGWAPTPRPSSLASRPLPRLHRRVRGVRGRRRARWRRRCRCTPPSRTARALPTWCSPRSTRHSPSTCAGVGAPFLAAGVDRATCSTSTTSRRSTTRSPVAGPNVPAGRAPARHRAEDARGDRPRSRRSADARHDLGGDARAWWRAPASDRLDATQRELLRTTRWDEWRHGDFWARASARPAAAATTSSSCRRPTVTSAHRSARRRRPSGWRTSPNGVDTDCFRPRALTPGERRARLLRGGSSTTRRAGTDSGGPGSVRTGAAISRLFGAAGDRYRPHLRRPVPGLKRVPLLVRAFARARPASRGPAPLLVWGGYPGEWEGDHPHTVAERGRRRGRLLRGWRGHDELPVGLAMRRRARQAIRRRAVSARSPLEAMSWASR